MIKIYNTIVSKLDIHTIEVIRKSSASLIVKVLGMIVSLLVSVYLGRTLGAEGLGVVNLANRVGSLLLVFTIFGMNNVLVKYISINREKRDFNSIANYIYSATKFNGFVALVIAVLGLLLVPLLVGYVFNESQLRIPLILAFVMIIPQTYSRVFASGLIGYKKIWQSNLVENTLSIWVVGAILLIIHYSQFDINVENVAMAYAIGRLVVSFSIFFYWKKIRGYQKDRRTLVLKPMLKMALPMLLVSTSIIIAANADIVMLGWLSDAKQVGLYSVAATLALLTSFFLQLTNSSISPKLASLYAEGKINELNILVQRVTSGLIFIAILFVFIFVFLGKYILQLWGDEFDEAFNILIILCIGQFVNISTGASGLLLIMCGYEKVHSKISLFFVLLNVVMNYFLISNYGAVGAALSTAITEAGINIVKVIYAKKYVGVLTLPFLKS
ncbi:flippase [Carboxylicivirga mesophila]|uniref:Flippase n=1 Tax=Carboxylicivirga mesophila TaxID=1166478 RepID=A0ABS5K5H3_9BACT|nr:flippase [Carboxylicivirga mesophila]MBS2210206.1 flippase [Carboxylicivirga mesophila]